MPETIPIEMPTPAAPVPAPALDSGGGKEKLGSLFDSLHAENTGAPPVTEPAPAPPVPPTKPPTTTTAPPADEFVPPDILLGGEPASKPAEGEMPSVADLMPEEPPVAIRTEKGKADYKKWREHQLMLETKLKERNGTTAEPSPDLVARNKELEQRLTEMSSVTERIALMEHPAFKQQFTVPRQQMLAQAKEAIEMAGGEYPAFEKMLSLTGKARIEAIDSLMEEITSPTLRNQLGNMINGIENLDRQREAVMADVKGNHERLELQTRAQRQQQMEAQVNETASHLDSAIQYLADKEGFTFFKDSPGNDKWNSINKTDRDRALYILTKASPAEAILAAARSTKTDQYKKYGDILAKKVETLEAELAELKGAQPRIGDGGGALDTPTNGDESGIAGIFKRASEGGVFGS